MVQKVAIVTGASSGLGQQLAIDLYKNDYNVAVCSRHIIKNSNFLSVKLDVTKKDQVKKFIKKIMNEYGRVDVVVNNAGYVHPSEFIADSKDEHLFNSFETNVYGAFYFMREIVPIMKKQGSGKIINIVSKAATYANPTLAIYSASKGALLKMTESVAKEFRDTKTDIYCVSISPAGINTKMRQKVYGKKDAKKQMDVMFVSRIITEIISRGAIPGGVHYNNISLPHINVPNGANIIIKKERIFVRGMEDG